MEHKVKTAVVGCGAISGIYIKNLKSMFSMIDLVAIGNRTMSAAEARAEEFGIGRVMTIDEIAADPEIELVVNLTPAYAHYEIIKQMLLAGKHVWTEKTMTVTAAQARELVELAESRGLYIGVAPDTVLGAGLQTARQALDTGMIGQVTSGIAVINRDQVKNAEFFTFLRGEGGSLAYDVGIYYIAALISLLGPVESVTAFGAPARERDLAADGSAGAEDWIVPGCNLLSASLRFASGAIVSVHFDGNTINAPQHNITLFGRTGILKIGDPNRFDGNVTLIRAGEAELELPFTHGYDGVNTQEPTKYDRYGHRGVGAAELAYAIRQGRPNRCSKEYGLHCLEILEAMETSTATGKAVDIEPRFEMKPLEAGHFSAASGGQPDEAERSLVK